MFSTNFHMKRIIRCSLLIWIFYRYAQSGIIKLQIKSIRSGIIQNNHNKFKNPDIICLLFPTTNSICYISYNLCCCKNKFYEDGRIPTEFCTKYTSCAHKFDALHCRSRRYLYAIWHRNKPECDSI